MELKICMFLSTLFWNEDFISQESPILADVEKINFWFLFGPNETSAEWSLLQQNRAKMITFLFVGGKT